MSSPVTYHALARATPFAGYAKLYDHPNGALRFAGMFEGGAAHGCGMLYASDGRLLYVGLFRDGFRWGVGKSFREADGTPLYEGAWRYDTYHGRGCMWNADGTVLHDGEWCTGTMVTGGHAPMTPRKRVVVLEERTVDRR